MHIMAAQPNDANVKARGLRPESDKSNAPRRIYLRGNLIDLAPEPHRLERASEMEGADSACDEVARRYAT